MFVDSYRVKSRAEQVRAHDEALSYVVPKKSSRLQPLAACGCVDRGEERESLRAPNVCSNVTTRCRKAPSRPRRLYLSRQVVLVSSSLSEQLRLSLTDLSSAL